ncbi:Sodium/myo-inositol cotransporter [Schistosoma japonicum]|nr:Sodium/myo-inositol cotransporter [Schistosoma japonicum]
MGIKVDFWDISVLILYLICLFSTGLYSLFTHRRGTITDYFLAGRFVTWLPIGASLFASNIGSEHFIGLAGSGSVAGIAVGAFELNVHLDASIILQLLGWVFLPVYIASGVNTLPEYMRNRFGGSRIQIYLAIMSLFFITAIITVTGGLAAVLYTDTLQFFVMIAGSTVLTILSFIKVGGFQGLLTAYGGAIAEVNISSSEGENLLSTMILTAEAKNITSLIQLSSEPTVDSRLKCALPSRKAFKLLREIDDPDMPWLGFLFGQTPSSIWYWCADQMMVQRTLAAKSLSHAQGATLMTGIIKQFPLFIIVIPGMISRVLYPNEIGCFPGSDCLAVCGHRNGCSNMAYPKLVVDLMPSGLRGLMLTVMIAALISDLTSIFNSASTLFTVDVYQKWRSSAQNTELMIVGRAFVIVLVALSVAWIPIIQHFQGDELYIYIQAIAAYLTPPIASVYLCAVLWKRCNEKGAFTGLIYGLIIGLIRMILTLVYVDPICGEADTRPWFIKNIHYMYFAVFSFTSTAILVIVVSLFSAPPTPNQLHRLTYWTAWNSNKEDGNDEIKHSSGSIDSQLHIVDYLTAPGLVSPIDFKTTVNKPNSRITFKFICLWLCGMENLPCSRFSEMTDKIDESKKLHFMRKEEALTKARLNSITSLHQDPRAKFGLLIGLIGIISLSIFGYIFYSLYFGEIAIGPIPLVGNSTLIQKYSKYITHLQNHNIIKFREK